MKILVVDIGGTSIKYACMREDMTMLTRGKIPTPKEGREELIEAIGKLYDGLPDVEEIAISMPGIIDSAALSRRLLPAPPPLQALPGEDLYGERR